MEDGNRWNGNFDASWTCHGRRRDHQIAKHVTTAVEFDLIGGLPTLAAAPSSSCPGLFLLVSPAQPPAASQVNNSEKLVFVSALYLYCLVLPLYFDLL